MTDQITPLQPGNHQPMGVDWAGSDVEKVDEDDYENVEENGTDYEDQTWGKSQRLYKSLIHDESLLKSADESLEKAQVEETPILKSFFAQIEANPTLMEGINSSPFLYEMVKSIGYSFMNVEDRLGAQMLQMDSNYDAFAKSIDGVFESLGKSLNFINGTAEDIDMNKSGTSNQSVEYLEKGNFEGAQGTSHEQIIGLLLKGVGEGNISPTEVVKFETTGAMSPHIQKSLGL